MGNASQACQKPVVGSGRCVLSEIFLKIRYFGVLTVVTGYFQP